MQQSFSLRCEANRPDLQRRHFTFNTRVTWIQRARNTLQTVRTSANRLSISWTLLWCSPVQQTKAKKRQ